jgi:hypothetical protein
MNLKVIFFAAMMAAPFPVLSAGYATLIVGKWQMTESTSEVRDLTFNADKTYSIRLFNGAIVKGTYSIEKYGHLAMALDSCSDVPVGAVIELSLDNNRLTIRYRRHQQHFVRNDRPSGFSLASNR